MALKQDLVIERGKTYTKIVRWETTPFVYKPISGITKAAPAVVSCTSHGVPDGWRVAIVSVQGMTEINASTPPKTREFVKATVLTSSSLELNTVNSAEFSTYTSGGYVQYYTPKDLTDYTGRMAIMSKAGGTLLVELTTTDGEILVDNAGKTITIQLTAAATEAFTWKKGVYELEMVHTDGTVVALMTGNVTSSTEINVITTT